MTNKVLDLAQLTTEDDKYIVTNNILTLKGEINHSNTGDIIDYIIAANYPEEGYEKLDNINIIIDSPGGDMDATLALISIMRASTIPITTVSIGSCASGGLMIAIAGDIRLVDKYCGIMSHTLSTGYPEFAKHGDLERWLASVKTHAQKIVDLYKEHTGLTEKVIRKKLLPEDKDVYLTAKQALEFKLFDDYFVSFSQLGDA